MAFRGWDRVTIVADAEPSCPGGDGISGDHQIVEAIAPVIISASRATDIPAFYAQWFIERLKRGYSRWINPFSHRCQYVSFANARVIVFWSKNPRPLIEHLPELDRRGIHYYFQFTLNDYDNEGIEPCVPPVDERIETFIQLSSIVGRNRVIWRFDPLVLSDTITVDTLIARIGEIGRRIHQHTRRLVFSFIDIEEYRTVAKNLRESGFAGSREFTDDEKQIFAEKLKSLNAGWGLELFTCAEEIDLTEFGIHKGSCIDSELMAGIFSDDRELMEFLRPTVQTELLAFVDGKSAPGTKDPGQRKECGCSCAKDIGQYNTCMHLCTYCYANKSADRVGKNYSTFCQQRGSGEFPDSIVPP